MAKRSQETLLSVAASTSGMGSAGILKAIEILEMLLPKIKSDHYVQLAVLRSKVLSVEEDLQALIHFVENTD